MSGVTMSAMTCLRLTNHRVPGLQSLCRAFSADTAASSSKMVDDLLQYVFSSAASNHDQALDIIKSGLGAQPDAESGLGSARLHLGTAELERDRSNWAAAVDSAAAASKAARAAEHDSAEAVVACSQLELAAYTSGTLSYLTQGKDDEALDLSQHALDIAHQSLQQHGGEQQSWAAMVESNAMLCLVQHARGDLNSASTSADVAQALADHTDPRRATSGAQRDAAILAALQRIGALRLAMGEYDEATSLFDRAAAGARHALSAGGASSVSMSAEPSPWALRETLASACSGPGQGSLGQKQWAAAEEPLSEAVNEADGVTSEKHPRAVPLLVQLGLVFARTSRVTIAEGLYRQAARILQLDPAKGYVAVHPKVHSSVAAALAWRYAQLLAALPKRDTETEAWKMLARDIQSTSNELQSEDTHRLEEAYGELHSLQGKGAPGKGDICDIPTRRMLQYAP